METLRRWWHAMFHNKAADEARARVEKDSEKMDRQVERFERNTEDLQRRVNTNHITNAVAALWRNQ